MTAYFNGQPVFGPRGPVGPDGNPVGTVIAYLGTTAPKDYLICDGSEYNVSDYPDLARFFRKEFGQADWYGGDGETTFAVPDFRNLFLRGFHGDAEEQLSGEIGDKQEGTNHIGFTAGGSSAVNNPYIRVAYDNLASETDMLYYSNPDSVSEDGMMTGVFSKYATNGPLMPKTYTARPVNAAVLYCIKAVTSYPAENVFSLEEQVIGRWIDGRPVYQKTFVVDKKLASGFSYAVDVSDLAIDFVVDSKISNYFSDSSIPISASDFNCYVGISVTNYLSFYTDRTDLTVRYCTIFYVKTTD